MTKKNNEKYEEKAKKNISHCQSSLAASSKKYVFAVIWIQWSILTLSPFGFSVMMQ